MINWAGIVLIFNEEKRHVFNATFWLSISNTELATKPDSYKLRVHIQFDRPLRFVRIFHWKLSDLSKIRFENLLSTRIYYLLCDYAIVGFLIDTQWFSRWSSSWSMLFILRIFLFFFWSLTIAQTKFLTLIRNITIIDLPVAGACVHTPHTQYSLNVRILNLHSKLVYAVSFLYVFARAHN